MNPICFECLSEMYMERMGIHVSNYPKDSIKVKAYSGDMWTCPVCGYKVISGYGQPFISKNNKEIIFVD